MIQRLKESVKKTKKIVLNQVPKHFSLLGMALSAAFAPTTGSTADTQATAPWLASTGFYNLEQGGNNWYYKVDSDVGYYQLFTLQKNLSLLPTYYEALSEPHLNQYRPQYDIGTAFLDPTGGSTLHITKDTQTPSLYRGAVREWKAPKDGTIQISGKARKFNVTAGDGVEVEIRRYNDRGASSWADSLWFKQIPFDDEVGYSHDLTIPVRANDTIQFMVRSGDADEAGDRTLWNPSIRYTDVSPKLSPITHMVTAGNTARENVMNIRAAIEVASRRLDQAQPFIIQLPNGTVQLDDSLTINGKNITILGSANMKPGEEHLRTRLVMNSASPKPVFVLDASEGCTLKNFTLDVAKEKRKWIQATVNFSLFPECVLDFNPDQGAVSPTTFTPHYVRQVSSDGIPYAARFNRIHDNVSGFTKIDDATLEVTPRTTRIAAVQPYPGFTAYQLGWKPGVTRKKIHPEAGSKIIIGEEAQPGGRTESELCSVYFKFPKNTTIQGVEINFSNGHGFYGYDEGDTTFMDVVVGGAELQSTGGSAIKFVAERGVLKFKNGRIARTGQCGIEIQEGTLGGIVRGSTVNLSKVADSGLAIKKFKVNDRVEFFTDVANDYPQIAKYHYIGRRKVTAVNLVTKTVSFDSEVPTAANGVLLCNLEAMGNQMVVSDSYFRLGFGAAISTHGVGALINDNRFEDTATSILFSNANGIMARNVTVRGNTFDQQRQQSWDASVVVQPSVRSPGSDSRHGGGMAEAYKFIDNRFMLCSMKPESEELRNSARGIVLSQVNYAYFRRNFVQATPDNQAYPNSSFGEERSIVNVFDAPALPGIPKSYSNLIVAHSPRWRIYNDWGQSSAGFKWLQQNSSGTFKLLNKTERLGNSVQFDRLIDRWFINNGEQWLRGDGTWLWGNPQGSYLDGTLWVDTLTDGDPVIEWKSFHSGTLQIISNATVINPREPAKEAEYNASQVAANGTISSLFGGYLPTVDRSRQSEFKDLTDIKIAQGDSIRLKVKRPSGGGNPQDTRVDWSPIFNLRLY